MTPTEAYFRVLETLKLTEDQLPYGQVGAKFSDALQAHSESIAGNLLKRELYRNSFNVSVVSGVGDLTTHLAATEPLLLEFNPSWEVYYAADTSYPYQRLADNPAGILAQPTGDIGWWWVQGTNLKVITSAGVRTPTATVVVIGNVAKTLTNITNKQYGDEFIATLVEMVKDAGQVPVQSA